MNIFFSYYLEIRADVKKNLRKNSTKKEKEIEKVLSIISGEDFCLPAINKILEIK